MNNSSFKIGKYEMGKSQFRKVRNYLFPKKRINYGPKRLYNEP